MQISDFIGRYGLVFMSRPAEAPVAPEGRSLDVRIVRGREEMITQVSLPEGRELNEIALLARMQDGFKMLETRTHESLLADLGAGIVAGLSATRDNFRRLMGESGFRCFIDEVRPAAARG